MQSFMAGLSAWVVGFRSLGQGLGLQAQDVGFGVSHGSYVEKQVADEKSLLFPHAFWSCRKGVFLLGSIRPGR